MPERFPETRPVFPHMLNDLVESAGPRPGADSICAYLTFVKKYGIKKTYFKTNEEKFNNYKEDFKRGMDDLFIDIRDKLVPVKYLIKKQNKNNQNVKSSYDEGKLPLINRINNDKNNKK